MAKKGSKHPLRGKEKLEKLLVNDHWKPRPKQYVSAQMWKEVSLKMKWVIKFA